MRRELVSHTPQSLARRRGFSLIELLVVIGIIAVLIGLALPSFGRSIGQARQTRDLGLLSQNITVMTSYIHDWKDVFPIADANAWRGMSAWAKPLVTGGYLPNEISSDPIGLAPSEQRSDQRFWQSACMTMNPKYFEKESTPPRYEWPAEAVRQTQVLYPSLKGWMVRMYVHAPVGAWPTHTNPWGVFFNGGPTFASPYAMADASAGIADAHTFNFHGDPPLLVEGIGHPIIATWGGYASRDR